MEELQVGCTHTILTQPNFVRCPALPNRPTARSHFAFLMHLFDEGGGRNSYESDDETMVVFNVKIRDHGGGGDSQLRQCGHRILRPGTIAWRDGGEESEGERHVKFIYRVFE